MAADSDAQKQMDSPLQCLPAELRFLIYNHLFTLNNVPPSYGYTGLPHNRPSAPLRTHALLLASSQLSLEYRQAFYERTRFFLRIDTSNAFRGAPGLSTTPTSSTNTPIPDFWNTPTSLVTSLRHCTLYIEIGDIAPHARSTHSLALEHRANASLSEAKLVREEMKRFSSFAAMQAANSHFDNTLVAAVHALLDAMKQLRSVQLVWDTGVDRSIRRGAGTCWGWEELGVPFVRVLEGRKGLREVMVRVGDSQVDHVRHVKRGEGGTWVAVGDKPETVAFRI
jgi:hypothetical protein